MFWSANWKWRLGFGLLGVFGLLIGFSRCSPIAPNLSKYDTKKSSGTAVAPPGAHSHPRPIQVLVYSSEVKNLQDADSLEKWTVEKAEHAKSGLRSETLSLSEGADETSKERFLKFKNAGKTEIEISTDPFPYSVEAVFGVNPLLAIETEADLLSPWSFNQFFLFFMENASKDFSSIKTKLTPSPEGENLWTLELLPSESKNSVTEFQELLQWVLLHVTWKN